MNREEPAGLGGPGVEPYVMDSRGALVQRRNVIQKERLSLCHCLVLTCLIVRISKMSPYSYIHFWTSIMPFDLIVFHSSFGWHISCLLSVLNRLLMHWLWCADAQEAKDLYNLLKDCATDDSLGQDVVKLQVTICAKCVCKGMLSFVVHFEH